MTSFKTILHGWLTTFVALVLICTSAYADGNETLGTPSITIASGSGFVAAGVGLTLSQPGVINLNVPLGVTINQVLLYWEGQHSTPNGDNQITANANNVIGTLIGGPDFFFNENNGTLPIYSSTYRADITALNLVSPGANAVSIGGMSFGYANNGAGLLVIYDDGTDSEIKLVDGNDLAYKFFPAPRTTTIAKTFTFSAAADPRSAKISLFFSSIQGITSTGGVVRPNEVRVTVGATVHVFDDELLSSDGQEWDTFTKLIPIPAGETQMTIQAISGPGGDDDPNTPAPKPASLTWNAAAMSLQTPEEECTGTIGDFVWKDSNCDGTQNGGEPGIAGVVVRLLDCNTGAILDATVTDANGHYAFTGLCEGCYKVKVDSTTLPAGMTPTTCSNTPNVGTNSNCSPAEVNLVGDNAVDNTIDFGYCLQAGGQGCTPGYWKQRQHFGSYPGPITPSTLFSSANTGFENAFPGKTLLQVLGLNGTGKLGQLGFHTVAAFLSSKTVNYAFTTAQVVTMFNNVYPGTDAAYEALKNIFAAENERGCPLGRNSGNNISPGNTDESEHRGVLRNFPNPFNPSTEIYFQIPADAKVTLRIFNMLGQEVKTLVNAELGAGAYNYTWDATDNHGSPVSSGVYFYHISAGDFTAMNKMSLMR